MYKSSFKKNTVSAFWFRPQNQYFHKIWLPNLSNLSKTLYMIIK